MSKTTGNIEEVTEAVEEAENAKQTAADLLATEREAQSERERRLYLLMGRAQAFGANRKFNTVGELRAFEEIKTEKLYKPMTWDGFCEKAGQSRSHLDEQLRNLATLGPDFLEAAQHLNLGYRQLRQLRYAAADGDLVVEGEFVVIDEEKIPFGPDYIEDIKIALERIAGDSAKLKEELARERKDREKLVKEETRGLRTENQALVKELQATKANIPDDKDYAAWAVDQVRKIQDMVNQVNMACTKLIVDGRLADDRVTQGHIYGAIEAMGTTLDDLANRLGEACPRSEI